jgi:hypothetical protein
MYSKALLLFFLIFFAGKATSQSLQKEFSTYFAWEVKQVDEFIERFNNNNESYIKEYLRRKEPGVTLTREKMIKSLFNAKGSNWNFQEITSFIKQVNDIGNPQFLDFDGENWFAKVNSKILYNGKPYNATLILTIDHLPDGGSRWIIADVKFVEKGLVPVEFNERATTVSCPSPADPTVSLSPVSHAIDFMNIDLATQDPRNIGNFVIDPSKRSNNLNFFIDACLKNKLKIVRATSITYSFLQIKGWRIEVKQFNRQSLNSGWLISKLVKLS